MLLKKEITEKSELWGVLPDTVDKDWVLGHFLSAFYQVDEHFEKLVFKGGTCLRKCRFPDYRFSEDLDFTSIDPDYKLTRELIIKAIKIVQNKSGILFHLAQLKDLIYKDELTGFQARIHYWGANHGKNQPPPSPERWLTGIKLEITLYEQLEFKSENRPIEHSYSDRDSISKTKIPCFDILPSVNEGDSTGFYEATGSTSSRVPAGFCCRPLTQFASQTIPVCPTVKIFLAAFTSAFSSYPQTRHLKSACDSLFSFAV
ncbi:hypothetical protein ES705_51188 [subsurface metagenome]